MHTRTRTHLHRLVQQRLSLGELPVVVQQPPQVVERQQCLSVALAQHLAPPRLRLAQQRLRLGQPPLPLQQPPHVVDGREGVAVARAEHLTPPLLRLAQQRLL